MKETNFSSEAEVGGAAVFFFLYWRELNLFFWVFPSFPDFSPVLPMFYPSIANFPDFANCTGFAQGFKGF